MQSQNTENNKFLGFIEKIEQLPLWIKEVTYVQIHDSLHKSVTQIYMDMLNKKKMFQYYEPILTFKGKQEIENREKGFHLNIYKFLECVQKGQNIIEITINNFWTLEETAIYFTDCLSADLVSHVDSKLVETTAMYLSGKIRLGEYFVRLDKITITQLDEALRSQKQIETSTGDKIGIASVFVNLGLLSNKDIQAILLIKDEAKKRYLIDTHFNNFNPTAENSSVDSEILKKQVAKLQHDNKILKDQLRKILNLSEKTGE